MAFSAVLPVRLDMDVEARLEKVAARAGTTKSALIRLLAKTFCDQVVGADGSVRLPPNWQEILKQSDGRTPRKRSAAGDGKLPSDAAIKEAEISGTAQLVVKAALAELGLKPKAASPSGSSAGPGRPVRRGKGGRPVPRTPAATERVT